METTPYLSFRSAANLVVLEDGAVRSFPLEMKKNWTIGRATPDTEQDIMLDSKIASRQHGKIQNIDGEWYYIELGSLNGTYFNGEKIKVGSQGKFDAVKLSNGDILRIDSEDLESPEERGVWMMFSTEGIGNQWKTISLRKKETHFGRDEELCDVTLPLPYISGRHMTILRKNDNYYVMDCDSMAGTWVNNQAVHGEVKLREKDVISVCDCIMVFAHKKILYNIPSRAGKNNVSAIKQVQVAENVNAEEAKTQEVAENEAAAEVCEVADNKPIILKANIKSRKVPSNTGHGEKELIRDVRVEVQEGTLVALLGGAGAGKSTVMNCMNGMDTVGMTGTVEYNGVDLIKNFDRMKYLIGSVPQMETFHESLTVEQELTHAAKHRLPGDTKKAEIKERVDYTLKQLGIESIRKNRISKCSGGEKRRVNIGIELVADRQLLCLDEPDAGLDPGNKRKLFETLRSLAHDEGKSILAIIHDVSDIELFDKVIIMNKVDNVGRLAFAGTPKQAKEHFGVDIKDVYQLMAKDPEKYVYGGE